MKSHDEVAFLFSDNSHTNPIIARHFEEDSLKIRIDEQYSWLIIIDEFIVFTYY